MSVEIGQKVVNLDEVYSVAVDGSKVRVGRILSNELSTSDPKKAKGDTTLPSVVVPQQLKKVEYLRAYLLVTISELARLKKAGRKSIVDILLFILNNGLIPKGFNDEDTNLIECLVNSIKKGGEVEKNGTLVSTEEALNQADGDIDEEEEKVEPPKVLELVTPEELFILGSMKNFLNGVASIETKNLENLTNKMMTSFALSAQAFGLWADAFNDLWISQGLNNKWSQIVKNTLLTLASKSQALEKKSKGSESSLVSRLFSLFTNFVYLQSVVSTQLKAELNNEAYSVFSDKKASEYLSFIDRSSPSAIRLLESLNKTVFDIITLKLNILSSLGGNSDEFNKDLESTVVTPWEFLKLKSFACLLSRVWTQEEFIAYQALKAKNDE